MPLFSETAKSSPGLFSKELPWYKRAGRWGLRKLGEQVGDEGIFSGSPLMDVLDAALVGPYAITGAAKGFAKAGREQRGRMEEQDREFINLRDIGGLAVGAAKGVLPGVKGRAAFGEVLREMDPETAERHPWVTGGLGVAGDILMLKPGVAVTKPITKLAARGARAAAIGRPLATAERAATTAETLQRPTAGGLVGLLEKTGAGKGVAPRRQALGEWLQGRDILREARSRETLRAGRILRERTEQAEGLATEAEALATGRLGPTTVEAIRPPVRVWKPGTPLKELREEERHLNRLVGEQERRVAASKKPLDVAVDAKSEAGVERAKALDLRQKATQSRRDGHTALAEHQEHLARQHSRTASELDRFGDAGIASHSKTTQDAMSWLGRMQQQRVAASGEARRVAMKMRREGVLRRERRGIAADIPAAFDPNTGWKATGEELTGAHVQALAAGWAEGMSPSGLARTPVEARAEVVDLARSLGIKTDQFLSLAKRGKNIGVAARERLIASGAITRAEAEAMERSGGYIRRVYELKLKNIDKRIAELQAAGETELADRLASARANIVQVTTGGRAAAKLRMLTERLNLPVDVRRELGEIAELAPRIWMQQGVFARIWPRMELFRELSRDARVVSAEYRPNWLRMPTQRAEDLIERAGKLAEAGKLSEAATVMEEASHTGWGMLAGKWVHPVMHDALVPKPFDHKSAQGFVRWLGSMAAPTVEREAPKGIWAAEAAALGQLKRWWVPWSGAGQIRNMGGNMIAMHSYGGVPAPLVPYFYLKGMWEIHKNGSFWRKMQREMSSLAEPAIHTDFQVAVKTLRETMRGAKVSDSLWRKIRNAPYRFFGLNEAAAKTGTAMYQHAQGISYSTAAKVSETAIFHYGDVARIIDKFRMYGPIPFPTYWWKNLAMFPKTLMEHPERIGLYTRGMEALAGGRPKEEVAGLRKLQPEYEKVGLPVPIPGEDAKGRVRWYRAGYVLPWGSMIGEPGVGALAGPAGEAAGGRLLPVTDPLVDVLRNQTRWGGSLWEEEDSRRDKWTKIGWHLVSSYLPQGYLVKAGADTVSEKMRLGRGGRPLRRTERKPMSAGQLAARAVGVSLYIQDVPLAVKQRRSQIEAKRRRLAEWTDEQRKSGRDPSEWKAERDRRVEALGKEMEEFAKIVEGVRPRLVVPANKERAGLFSAAAAGEAE